MMDHLWWLFLPLPMLCYAAALASCRHRRGRAHRRAGFFWCCCESGQCDTCTGATPGEWTVVISGMTNDSCANCTNYDGTYIIPGPGFIRNDSISATCDYDLSITEHCTGYGVIRISSFLSTTYRIAVRIQETATPNNPALTQWTKIYGATPPDCSSLVDEELAFTNDVGCNGSSATCFITASG